MLIDAHMHIFPAVNGYNGGGILRSQPGGLIKSGTGMVSRILPPAFRDTAFPPEVLIEYMDWQGVDHAVLLQGPFYGELNEYVFDAVKRWPDRLTGAAMVDPYFAMAPRALEYIVDEQEFKILKLECSEQFGLSGLHPSLSYTDASFQRVWELADHRELTVVVDTGSPGTAGFQLDALDIVASKYPRLKLVLCHLCFPPGKADRETYETEWRRCLALGKHHNVWFDISSLVGLQGDEYPFPLAQGYIRMAYEELGAGKLIFGTDAPGMLTKCTYQQSISYVRDHCTFFRPEEKAKVLYQNALEVYNIQM